MGMGWLIKLSVFLYSVAYVFSLESQSHLRISNNGYELLVVGVHDSVPDNPATLQKLKTIFTKASKVLYTATRKRAYFKKVFFLLPSTWASRPEYKPSTSVKLTGADIIFSAPKGATRRSFSHTRSYAGCGHQAFHTQLTTDVLNSNHPLAQSSPEKYIVHEFATLRYGVFEEYPNPGENEFYFSTTFGRLDPVRCTIGLRGIIRSSKGYCLFSSIDPETGEFPPGCHYMPYPYRANGTASMMDHQYIREIQDFCDDDHTPGHFSHNVEPPNRQNRLCSHRSTWNVISNTADFKSANSPTSLSDSQLTPQFIIFRAPNRRRRRLAVVLDSPQEIHKRLRLHQAVDHFLSEGFNSDTRVAIIHNDANSMKLRKLRNRRSSVIKSVLQNIDQFSPSISKTQIRIQRGVELLRKSNLTTPGVEHHLIWITCDNQSYVEEKDFQNLADLYITPHIIHCGGDGIKHLEEVTTQQGGIVESKGHQSIFHAIQRLSDKLHDEKDQIVQISNENLEIDRENTHYGNFILDETLQGELVIRIHYNFSAPSLRVLAPNGSEYELQTINMKLKYIRLAIPIADNEHGKWSFAIDNNSPYKESVHMMVIFRPRVREDETPIRTNAWIKVFHEYLPPRIGVYAEVMYGGHPVVNSNVTAHVFQNNRKVTVISLRDTGGGVDITKEDGIYSNFFTEIDSQGNHYVEVIIEDDSKKSEIHKTYEIQIPREEGISPDDPDVFHAPRLEHQTEKVKLKHGLKRSTSSGQFEIDHRWNIKPHADQYPPTRIIDLTVDKVDRKKRLVYLSWTATGDDLDTGRASFYEIRYHNNATALLHSPKDAGLVKEEDVLMGNLDRPKEAGQIEHVAVKFPRAMKWVAVMLRSVDKSQNVGDFSNMITTFFEL
ncbi:calcium-activated chloride channel regulator 3A-1-like isoform X1 [Saccostrea cucullata]|uniref:calcium-activated chloride channel regulator 3A-1-like isoform X1 n=1 Tax=Saccostrea cuccullata TaxID=36930 RepID=UPI002ED1E55A